MRVLVKGIGALILLLSILFGATELVILVAHQAGHQIFHNVNPTVAAATVTAASTVLVAIVTVIGGRLLERRKAVEAELRTSKIPVYTKLVTGMFTMLQGTDEEKEGGAAFFRSITPELINWASDDVLRAWSQFKRNAATRADPVELVFDFEKLLSAIRKDIGYSGRVLTDGDVLGLFVNDIDEQLALRKKKAKKIDPGATSSS